MSLTWRFFMKRKVLTMLICVPFLLAGCNSNAEIGPQGPKGEPGETGQTGPSGQDGIDGLTPYIGENGNWWIGNTDTGVKAIGTDGVSIISIEKTGSSGNTDTYTITFSNGVVFSFTVTNGSDGKDGADGKDGDDGKSAYEIYIEHYPGYIWGEEQWIRDLALGQLAVTISFETFGGQTIEPITYCKGEQVNINFEATKSHGEFKGWFFDSELINEIDYSFIAYESLTFYAGFELENIIVKFIADGSTYSYKEVEYGTPVDMPDNPSKLGYTFEKWIKEDGTEWKETSLVLDDDLVLYASFNYDFLEIPAVIINTNDGSDITSKEEYVASTVSICNTKEEWIIDSVDAGVRGRGNSSWNKPKKPLRIKFDKKQSILGSEYKAKSWTLIANYVDKSLLRNYIAYELGDRFDGIDFSSMHNLVDLYLNNEYMGVYLLCDQVQTGDGRVSIDDSIDETGNNGYFIERDARASSEGIENQDYFYFNGETYTFKTPDTEDEAFLENKDVEITYITNYLQQCWDAILYGGWDEVNNLIDIDSFVDPYIVDELFANNDCGYSSCFYYKDKDGKLFKGPLWDYDIGGGNINFHLGNEEYCPPDTKLWANDNNKWYKALAKRAEFVSAVAEKLLAYRDTIFDVLGLLDFTNEKYLYSYVSEALERNFLRWDIMGKYVYPEPESVYSLVTVQEQIEYLYNWLYERYNFMYKKFTSNEFIDSYKGTFEVDNGVEYITVYKTNNYDINGLQTSIAYSCDSSTGRPLLNGEGQINFEIVLKEGYEIDGVDVISGSYKNLKTPSDTGKVNTYRITKIKSDLIISITTKIKTS